MIQQALIEVVKNQLGGGVSEAEVREFLRRRGTDEAEIREIFELVSPGVTGMARKEVVADPIPTPEIVAEPTPAPKPAPAPGPIVPVVQEAVPVAPITKPTVPSPEPAPARTEAHGVVRPVPPLQPTVPFAVANGIQQPPLASVFKATASAVAEKPVSEIRNKKKIITFTAIAIVGIAVLALGIWFAYAAYFISPERDIDRAMSRLHSVESFTFASEIVVEMANAKTGLVATTGAAGPFVSMFAADGPATLTSNIVGSFDGTQEGDPRLAFTAVSTMDKWAVGEATLGFIYNNIDRVSYVNITAMPSLGFLNLSALQQQWFMVSDKDAHEQFGSPTDPASGLVPWLSKQERSTSIAAWKEHRFLTVQSTLADEVIDGVSSRHYVLAFDKEAFIRWLEKNGSPEARDMLSNVAIDDLHVWIGKLGGAPRKVQMHIAIDPQDSARSASVLVTLTGNSFDKPVDIFPPEDARSIDSALQSLFTQMLGGDARIPAPKTALERNARRSFDVEAITNAIKKNEADNDGAFTCSAGPLPTTAKVLGTSGYAIESCLAPWYLRALPRDPSRGTATMSGYSVLRDPKTGKITVRAPYAELGVKISATK
ncbi:hypothetical protein A2333_02665 [Candidatus Wolfebacteria bacterium RIFOXYB2_FULL_49_7]|uniref:Uncharacterized protein n=1 Tax=Candidatus Wolfebacteria bacterium RIFOXYB1_FULL_54_12 TaxID=1802559 RepID=A0A1F8DX97_9BACT|nr:MAG: hypothetical protein A2372_02050 [Candidatus Wolfebacteria bacterium RIFOXYB1_FULL_54_12]OGM96084.1 MAG: hypothetical protein A2333_02665 [Candidatus Wolfebacteria bacterium RIFOXYB2_FULL_49_7]